MKKEMNIFEKLTDSIITDNLRRELTSANYNKKSNLLETYALESLYHFDESSLIKKNATEEKNSIYLKKELRKYFNKIEKYPETIGNHPDFKELEYNSSTENHYIISVFVDIKGSTKLATIKNLSLKDVREIKNRILTTVISVFQVFDGHIHRLQGDAVFAFFGRRDKSKEDSVVDALNAVTILQYVFKNYLSELFEEMGYPSIDIRTGLDFGDDKDVLWSKYGIEGCNEVTTTSIYTDLAAKLQHKAGANKVMIGNNIKDILDLPNEFYSIKTHQKNYKKEKDEYILNYNTFRYKMWEFNWEKYISFIVQLSNPESLPPYFPYSSPKDFEIICFYENNGKLEKYERSSKVLEKFVNLQFKLQLKNYSLKNEYKKIIWEVNNRGVEASVGGNERLIFRTPNKEDSIFECPQGTAYKGHHYMRVEIKGQGNRTLGEDKFGIFIK